MNKYIVLTHTSKFGDYLRNLLIVCLVFEIASALSFIGYAVFVIVLAVVTLCSFFLLLINDTFRGLWQNLDNFSILADKLNSLIPVINKISIAISIAAIIVVCCNLYFTKNRNTFNFAIVNLIIQTILFVVLFFI